MIKSLYIKNFILIRETKISFQEGMTAITGETGAGKSILLGAMGLILGARADTKTIREGEQKCIIEAIFDIQDVPAVPLLLEENDLDVGDSICIMRREIMATGKSRAFINDTPVTMQVMREIGSRLMDIHSQHSNMLIGDPLFQIGMLDVVSENLDRLSSYKHLLAQYKQLYKAWQEKIAEIEQKRSERDYVEFQFNQLAEAHLKAGEEVTLEEQLEKARHAQDIVEALATVTALNESGEGYGSSLSAIGTIEEANKALEHVQRYWPEAEQLVQRLESVIIELKDMVRSVDDELEGLEVDPAQVDSMEQRLDQIRTLLFKHNKETSQELLELQEEYDQFLQQIDNSDADIKRMEKEAEAARKEALAMANELHEKRVEAAKMLSAPLESRLKELGVAGAVFHIEVKKDPARLLETGIDHVEFLFSANNQSELRPINAIASGGEMSRFMLALKTIMASHSTLPTIIFDEIDTGVSGHIAEKMGVMMQELSERLQVVAITHLPQIAALAHHQLRVYKKPDETGEYGTHIEPLTEDERVEEIAGMLSGSTLTKHAIENAKALLKKRTNEE